MRKATLIRLPEALFEAVRRRAFEERRSINALLVDAVERYMRLWKSNEEREVDEAIGPVYEQNRAQMANRKQAKEVR
ncbi:MAG: hypothetical protein AB1609_07875 [Bacillota bacterium]